MACCLVGVLLSTLPHVCMWVQRGDPYWVGDNDDVFYLTLAAPAYQHHPSFLTDPVRQEGGTSLYPWLPLVPGILATKAFCLGPMGVGLIWRAWAGLTIALAWYLVLRHYLQRPVLAAACAIFLMGDIGQLTAHLALRSAWVSAQVVSGKVDDLFDSCPMVHRQWRIVNPGLIQGSLLLFVWLLARAVERPTRSRMVWSGLGYGLLFYIYFYYWTAVGLGLLAGMALDAGRRRIYFHTGWLGGLLGAPMVIASYLTQQSSVPGFLQRQNKFVPIGRFDELLLPKLGLLALVVSLVWVWIRRRDLIYLWCLAAAGLALLNHQLVTGLQIENVHWHYVWGPLLSLLIVLLIAGEVAKIRPFPRMATWGLVGLLGIHLASALWLRAEEALHTSESQTLVSQYQLYRGQRLQPGVTGLNARAVVAGDPAFVDFAVILEDQCPLDHYSVILSPDISDDEWDERVALNSFLRGQDLSTFTASQTRWSEETVWGLWAAHRVSPEARQLRLARRLAAFRWVERDPRAAMDKYAVRYVALPAGQPGPTYLKQSWDLRQEGPTWNIWQRTVTTSSRD